MPNAWLVELLRGLELFQGLKPQQLYAIARNTERVQFKPGDHIISEGEAGDAAYVIVAGAVIRSAGPASSDAVELGAGTLIGEMAMLVETTHSSTVICREPVRALKITRAMLLEGMKNDPTLAEHILERLSARLKRLADELRSIDKVLAVPTRPAARRPTKPLLALAPPSRNIHP